MSAKTTRSASIFFIPFNVTATWSMLGDAVPTQLWPGSLHQARGIIDLSAVTRPITFSLTVTPTGPAPISLFAVIPASTDSQFMPKVDSTTITTDKTLLIVPL